LKSILVVEDNQVLAELIAEVLQEEGYSVGVACNGHEALERLPEVNPDLVITDLMMPKLSGEQVCNVIQADPNYCSVPVVLMTARQDEVARVSCRFDAFLPKPFDLYNLLGIVQRLTSSTA
jgi:twitching motility two-component system response regulator PilH